jgi:DNA polymerase alpha subunit B
LLQRPADPVPPSRMLEVAAQLLQQQSFLPLNPPPLHVNLDSSSSLSGIEFGEESPQILVLPSALKEFVDPVESSLIVNPSFLVRGGAGGGTFAEITLYPKGEDTGNAQPMDIGAGGAYNLHERIGIKIVKI